MAETISIPEILTGVALCLLGWTLYWIGLHAIGVAAGGALGALIGMAVSAIFDPQGEWTLPIMALCGGLGALVGVFVIKKAHRLVFFIVGLLAGGMAANITWPSVLHALGDSLSADYHLVARWVFAAVMAVFCGFLMVPFSHYLIIIATSIIGSMLLVLNLDPAYTGPGLVFFFVASLLIQTLSLRRLGGRRPRPVEPERG